MNLIFRFVKSEITEKCTSAKHLVSLNMKTENVAPEKVDIGFSKEKTSFFKILKEIIR